MILFLAAFVRRESTLWNVRECARTCLCLSIQYHMCSIIYANYARNSQSRKPRNVDARLTPTRTREKLGEIVESHRAAIPHSRRFALSPPSLPLFHRVGGSSARASIEEEMRKREREKEKEEKGESEKRNLRDRGREERVFGVAREPSGFGWNVSTD